MNFTVLGLFDSKKTADMAKTALIEAGTNADSIDVSPTLLEGKDTLDYSNTYDEDENTGGFWNWLFGDDENERNKYSHVSSRNTVVTVYANNRQEAQGIAERLDDLGAINVDEQYDRMNSTTQTSDNDVIPVVKEEVAVGKREVESGGVRIHTRVIEKPVEESVRLRSERVYVTRKPVDRLVKDADAFKDKTITMTEHAEEAVVEKTARVVEEISLNKEVSENVETINENVRETIVDVDNNLSGSLQTSANSVGHGKRTGTDLTRGFQEGRIDMAFNNVIEANKYFDFLIANGYDSEDITVLMSKDTKDRFYAHNDNISDTTDEALKGAGAGSAIGGTVGAVLGAIAAVGGSVLIPGLGLAVAGPLAAVLGGAGVGGASGALIGALTKAGLSDSVATEYKKAMDDGEVIISVDTKDNVRIFDDVNYGRNIYSGSSLTV